MYLNVEDLQGGSKPKGYGKFLLGGGPSCVVVWFRFLGHYREGLKEIAELSQAQRGEMGIYGHVGTPEKMWFVFNRRICGETERDFVGVLRRE